MCGWKVVIGLVMAALVLPACTVTREGSIQLLPDGQTTRMTMELDGQAGTAHGVHPTTGELLHGDLVPLEPSSMPQPMAPDGGGTMGFEPQPAPLTVGNSSRRMALTLRSDSGTRLECLLSIRRGVRPHGSGSCVDREGNRYHLEL